MNMFKPKPQYRIETGGFIASFFFKEGDIKNTYLQIDTVSNIWSMRIDGRTHAFGYLYAAAAQGLESQIHGYAVMMYCTAMALTQSQEFVDGLTKEINKYDKRLMTKAKRKAATSDEHEEIAAQAFMESVVEYAEATPKKRKKISKEDREQIKQAIQSITHK